MTGHGLVYIRSDGVCKTKKEWCYELGLSQTALTQRLKNGWSMDDALTIPKISREETGRRGGATKVSLYKL